MDRSYWMYGIKRSGDEYLACLSGFLKVAEENRVNKGENYIWCPCVDCQNCCMYTDSAKTEEHLIIRGFMRDYTCWSRHGEILVDHNVAPLEYNDDIDDTNDNNYDNISGVLHDCEDNVAEDDYEKFQQLFDESEKPYSYLEKTALQKFKERISSTEFQDISEKARMSSMCNTNPARVGPHGYRGNKAKWEKEKASGQLPSQLYEIKSGPRS
ncbi:unnamed protein product [Lactuca saligna]|uniref:Transposase-associated domain-containing protein n=1 Tax=Lactuca saligna TaxID=75948 RepID=A0AA35VE67_LACSI|nr:unnamed protein product [Lactuca saligna]